MDNERTERVKRTRERLIHRVLSRAEMHGWGIAERIKMWPRDVLTGEEGSPYPAYADWRGRAW